MSGTPTVLPDETRTAVTAARLPMMEITDHEVRKD